MYDDHTTEVTDLTQIVTEIHRRDREDYLPALLHRLRTVGNWGTTPFELARHLVLDKTTINRLLNALDDENRIERSDGRVRLIETTDRSPEGTDVPTTEETILKTDDAEADVDQPFVPNPSWPWWANTALEQIIKATTKVRRFVMADPSGVAALVATTVLSVVAVLAVVSLGLRFVQWLTVGDPIDRLSGAVPASLIAIDPIEHWLTAHTAGLPISVTAAAWTWAVVGLLLLAGSIASHVGAQLLWVAYGTATAAMAWLGTAAGAHRPIAAGLVAVAWVALSLLFVPGPGRPRVSRRVGRTNEQAA